MSTDLSRTYVLHSCGECRRITDHFYVEHGRNVELICDVCSEPAPVALAPRRELAEVA